MPEYTINASVTQLRSYRVEARNMVDAKDLVREEYNFLEFDIIDDEIDDVTVEE